MDVFDGSFIPQDLRAIPQNHADLIGAFLDEVVADPRSLNVLYRRNAINHVPDFDVKVIESLLSQGFNVSRISPKGRVLGNYRIIFAIDNRTDDIYILAIVARNFTDEYSDITYNYEQQHPITARICEEYNNRRIPIIGV